MSATHTRITTVPFEQVCRRLPEVAAKHKFSVLGVHDLREKLVSKGFPFARECRVFEVCSPQQAHQILSNSIEVASALPCRIAAYTEDGRTVLSTIKPEALLGLYSAKGGEQVAREVDASLIAIMDETCAGGAPG